MSFFAELRRRNVIRMAGLYLVGAWLIVQVAGTLLPIFGTPAWVLKSIVVVAAVGFVPALAFAWVFELTPDGLKRERDVVRGDGDERVDRTARKLDVAVIVLLLAIGGMMLWQRNAPAPAGAAAAAGDGAAVDAAAPGSAVEGGTSGATDASGANAAAGTDDAGARTPEPASIAVLPFVNMSADAENGYFADGISEELLNVLAGIEGLTVASRTSSFSFKGETNKSIPDIAAALGVRHVLEGSVRRQGSRVRITAQLIRAGTDRHLWSQTFDRDLDDIFAVQQEIAQAIADEMVDLLPVATRVQVNAATDDIAAYELMLRGRTRFHRRSELAAARADLEAAVARDPTLGEAWLYLAGVHYVIPGYEPVDEGPSYAAAHAAVARARALLPAHPLVTALEGTLAMDEGDYIAGVAALEKAAALPSTDSTPTMWYGLSLYSAGYVREAIAVLEKAQRADPLVGISNGYLGIARFAAGDEARAREDVATALRQGWIAGRAVLAIQQAARGETEDAIALLPPLAPDGERRFMQIEESFRAALRDRTKLDAYLASVQPGDSDESLLAFGLTDEFLDRWLARTRLGAKGEVRWILRSAWLPASLAVREDPRFLEIARLTGMLALWETRGWPDGCKRAGDRLDCDATR